MRVVFSNRAYTSILAETTEKIKTETGGLFLGKCIDDVWYVVEAIDPGPKSIFEVAYFEYDQKYTEHLINKIANLYDEKLELIGLWHRHPGSMDFFSSTDDQTNAKYASMNPKGAISGLVNVDPKFRLTIYQVDQPCNYSVIDYDVGDDLFPEKLLALKPVEKYKSIMDNALNPKANKNKKKKVTITKFMDRIHPYIENDKYDEDKKRVFATDASDELLEAFFDDISFLSEKVGIALKIQSEEDGISIYQSEDDLENVILCYKHKESGKYMFEFNDEFYDYESSMLKNAFMKYVKEKRAKKEQEMEGADLFSMIMRKLSGGRSDD